MAKVIGRDRVLEILRKSNPGAELGRLTFYVDRFLDYQAAQANIEEHGAIVLHPRTGAPIDNPYLKIRDSVGRELERSHLDSSELWKLHWKGRAAK